ncbi:MAG: type II secretion system ATPase GspE [Simkaniaceae bacterium]|nr:type II secretion system ATPase GspE [Simkaniaceae bacterium]
MHTDENYGLQVVYDLSDYPLVKERVRKLSYPFAKEKRVLPLEESDERILVAVATPFCFDIIEEVRCLLGKPIEEVLCSKEKLDAAIEHCYRQSENEASDYIQDLYGEGESQQSDDEEIYDLLDQRSNSAVIRLLNMVLLEALQQEASDVHFEPTENGLQIRYRIDGVLQVRHTPPRELQHQLLTRIKVMSKLDIAEKRLPQDGRIKLKVGGRDVDFRVSTIPVVYGERIVLRILDNSNIVVGLDHIGMPEDLLATFRKHISESQGIVLVTGPTGSGKTTTLYSAIREIQSSEMNIMTIEDPVEYKLGDMAQIGINSKIDLTFAKGLRSILRQDPDVIMVGEIRDRETAEIAIQASLTGHLVLSTLHTNDAPSALTRLIDMGIEPYLLSSTVLAVLAQRLVRKICPDCKVSYKPSDQELKDLGAIGDVKRLYKGKGCDNCFGCGYKGRDGLYELMTVTSPIKKQMLASGDAAVLQREAIDAGMRTLRDAGIEKALAGITSSSEVIRVTRRIG